MKVADFGVARVQAQSGVMTAETGTYRWMAPEVSVPPIISDIGCVICAAIGDLIFQVLSSSFWAL